MSPLPTAIGIPVSQGDTIEKTLAEIAAQVGNAQGKGQRVARVNVPSWFPAYALHLLERKARCPVVRVPVYGQDGPQNWAHIELEGE